MARQESDLQSNDVLVEEEEVIEVRHRKARPASQRGTSRRGTSRQRTTVEEDTSEQETSRQRTSVEEETSQHETSQHEASQRATSRQRPAQQQNSRQGSSSKASSHGSSDYKRLIVCCDGTWLDSSRTVSQSDDWLDAARTGSYKDTAGTIAPPSNITRLTHAIKSRSNGGVQQIVYYQAGVGSMGTISEKIIGGISGDGLAEYVRDSYSFLANNYDDGDEIFLIGFSRGAFTARSIAGLIANLGIMTKAGLASFPVIYQDFAHRNDRRYKSPAPNVPFPRKPSARDPAYAREMAKRRLTTLDVHIKAIGVFDTVGSLGIPKLPGSGFLSILSQSHSDYRFYDTSLDNCVDNAFQALALDERRGAFSPALWEKRGNNTSNLIQVWFPGVHSNVGGGYDDQELANITLAWMMAMLNPLLDLNLQYIMIQDKLNAQYFESKGQSPRAWSFGKIVDSATGLFGLSGKIVRTPGNYYRTDSKTGEPTRTLLKNTNEYIHASVRARFNLRGPGYADKGTYDPRALKDWRLGTEKRVAGLPTPWFWEHMQDNIVLPEAPLRNVEKMLLRMTPEVEDLIMDGVPQAKRKRKKDPASNPP